MKIAITGPDGAGKSTLCKALPEKLGRARVVYAGKSEFHLSSTKWIKALWDSALRIHPVLGFMVQHLLYYPAEYFENWWRLVFCYRHGVTIYDRHIFDRLVMKHSVKLRYECGKIGKISYLLQYVLNSFWSFTYRFLFPSINHVFVLLPDASLCYKRADGQYRDYKDAVIRVESYRMAYKELGKKDHYHLFTITASDSISDCLESILARLE